MDEARGTGRTSHQMLTAPKGAIYVWRGEFLSYARDLSRHLGRSDLWVIAQTDLTDRAISPQNILVIDHAVALTERQRASLSQFERTIFPTD